MCFCCLCSDFYLFVSLFVPLFRGCCGMRVFGDVTGAVRVNSRAKQIRFQPIAVCFPVCACVVCVHTHTYTTHDTQHTAHRAGVQGEERGHELRTGLMHVSV